MGATKDDYRHDLSWKGYDPDKVREILNLGQAQLQAQLDTALAADARATAMAGLYVTLGLAVLAAGLAVWDNDANTTLLWPAIAAAGLFLVAGARAGWAARPVEFYLPGTHPEKLFECRDDDLATILGGQAEIDDRDLRRNSRQMKKSARALMQAFWTAIAAPIVGFGVWLITVSLSG